MNPLRFSLGPIVMLASWSGVETVAAQGGRNASSQHAGDQGLDARTKAIRNIVDRWVSAGIFEWDQRGEELPRLIKQIKGHDKAVLTASARSLWPGPISPKKLGGLKRFVLVIRPDSEAQGTATMDKAVYAIGPNDHIMLSKELPDVPIAEIVKLLGNP